MSVTFPPEGSFDKSARILLHEVVAAPGHAGAALGFVLALLSSTIAAKSSKGAILLWVREISAVLETGEAYGPGLLSLGLSPDRTVIVSVRTPIDALRATLEGARCNALSVVLLETFKAVDLTSTRRLKLAAEKSGVPVFMIHPTSAVTSNAAQIRWRVQGVQESSKPDDAPRAAFKIEVLKHPAGFAEKSCIVEWDYEHRCFAQTLPVFVDALSPSRPLAA